MLSIKFVKTWVGAHSRDMATLSSALLSTTARQRYASVKSQQISFENWQPQTRIDGQSQLASQPLEHQSSSSLFKQILQCPTPLTQAPISEKTLFYRSRPRNHHHILRHHHLNPSDHRKVHQTPHYHRNPNLPRKVHLRGLQTHQRRLSFLLCSSAIIKTAKHAHEQVKVVRVLPCGRQYNTLLFWSFQLAKREVS
jgi:hypothetical protein